MRIIRDFASCPPSDQGTVLALGNFDGVHLGHQAILAHCADFAKTEGTKATVMTFEPHPREFFLKQKGEPGELRIYPFRRKAALLKTLEIDVLFVARFNRRFAGITAQSFIEDILHGQLKVRHVITGYNFAFGKGREGTTHMLAESAEKLGFGFTALPQIKNGEEAVSSSSIRTALTQGDLATASRMLGRRYTIEGRVRRGEQRGRNLGFPTANIALSGLFKPRFGVYAVRASVNSKTYDGVANIGIKPTFSATQPLLEVHCFGMSDACYGERARVELVEFLRDEQRFGNVEALKAQIAEDASRAKSLLKEKA